MYFPWSNPLASHRQHILRVHTWWIEDRIQAIRHYRFPKYVLILMISSLTVVRIAFVFGCESPSFRCWTQEHLRDLHPIPAVIAGQKRFCGNINIKASTRHLKRHAVAVPKSFRPRKAGARSLRRPGRCSSNPIGTYRYWKDIASQR